MTPGVTTTQSTTTSAPATTAQQTTTTPAPTTTSTMPVEAEGSPDILIAGEQGVILLRGDGTSDTLVAGPVDFALDDSLGGLLFQLQRGRFVGDSTSTDVWWIPAGATAAQELLVPGDGQYLTLYEARARGGDLSVWYTRWEGSGPDDLVETLRRFDVATGEVTDFGAVAAWESGVLLSFGGDIIAGSWYAEALCGMTFTDLTGEAIDFPAAPPRSLEGVECGDMAEFGELSADGTKFAYVELVREGGIVVSTDVVIVDSATGSETSRVVGVRPEQAPWRIVDLDLATDTLVVNRVFPDESRLHSPLVVDLGEGAPVIMEPPIPGWARIVRAPVALGGRVAAPGS